MIAAPSVRLRLIAFSTAIFVVAVLIAWAAKTSRRHFNALETRVREEQLGTLDIADGFQARIHRVNYTLLRFGTHDAGAQFERFQQESQGLNAWIDQQKALLTTPRERDVLEKIDRAYDGYLAASRNVVATAHESQDTKLLYAQIEKAAQASKPLLDLGYSLALANNEARAQWHASLRQSIGNLQTLIFVLLACLLALGGATSIFVYRTLIAPLRTQLAESRRAMERQEKLASLGVLAAGVAHEIRNPLTAIKLRLFTLRNDVPETGTEDVRVISSEIDRLERTVRDFLQFGRPSEPNLEWSSLAGLAEDVHTLLAEELEKRGIHLRLESLTKAQVQVDPGQMKQVLINLLRNAAESIKETGTITLRTRVGPAILKDQRTIAAVIEIEDTGGGIPPEVERRLFDPFFTTKETGTGLGLSIAVRIVEKHGGAIRFQTKLKHGTTFRIVLPLPAQGP